MMSRGKKTQKATTSKLNFWGVFKIEFAVALLYGLGAAFIKYIYLWPSYLCYHIKLQIYIKQ